MPVCKIERMAVALLLGVLLVSGRVAAPAAQGARAVVVLHGIGGATLGLPGARNSPLARDWPRDVLPGLGRPENLEFTEEGAPRQDTESAQLVPGDMMGGINTLAAGLGAEAQPFVYDWRYSVRRSAGKFADFLRDLRQRSSTSRIDVVAHSMGGLIVKQYLADHPSDHGVGTVILLATPHLGAPKALKVLRYGDPANLELPGILKLRVADACKMKRAAHNLPAVYDLLPSRRYLDTKGLGPYYSTGRAGGPNGPRRADATGGPEGLLFAPMVTDLKEQKERLCPLLAAYDAKPLEHLNAALVDSEVVAFHDALDRWTKPANLQLFTVAGYGHATLARIVDEPDTITYVMTAEGDGTVPLRSAEAVAADATYYVDLERIKADHGSMPGKRQVQELVRALLDGRAAKETKAVSRTRPRSFGEETRQTVPVRTPGAPRGVRPERNPRSRPPAGGPAAGGR